MTPEDFTFYQKLLQSRSGIYLTPDKTYLLETRLTPLCKTLGFERLDDYTHHLRSLAGEHDLNMIVGAMTTNETSFFRDSKPFQHLKNYIIPSFLARRSQHQKCRIWSAACSTGQEAYSIAMIAREIMQQNSSCRFEIIGTDIADHVLQKARSATYNTFEIQRGLSMPMIVRYFNQSGQDWVAKDELRSMVQFKKFNLLDPPIGLGSFDVVFCRNVLIYFNAETKIKVLKSIHNVIAERGFLLLGSCENVMSEHTNFVPQEDMHGLYVKHYPSYGMAQSTDIPRHF